MPKCNKCGKSHEETTISCCWIRCDCKAYICGRCGSSNLGELPHECDDDDYWCLQTCLDCGLDGCAMCI